MPKYRSVSQRGTYNQCPYRYKLERMDKVWQRPASWLSQGLAVHKAMEEWELSGRGLSRSELEDIYVDEYVRSINEQAEVTPNFYYWFGSGKYSGEADIERRFSLGLAQLATLIEWCVNHPNEKVWTTPDGRRAVELKFDVELGGVRVVGFIDQVVETPDGLIVRDIKTGAKPGDVFQLATYAKALEELYDVPVKYGDYFMGKTGKPTKKITITEKDKQYVVEQFKVLDDAINSGEFPPKPSKGNCSRCPVKTACEFRGA